ncbi:MAG: diaminopimelate decarboxylase [Candidatus Sumerlaeota bacterium]|nr:diaminopimelate decarboxylase [Candidatus Sumerlaeota bacterium]
MEHNRRDWDWHTSPLDFNGLDSIAAKVGTPFWLYDAGTLKRRIGAVKRVAAEGGVMARYAMKACSATRVVREMLANGIWIDAVSGNEVVRAIRAGAAPGQSPPVVVLTADVFRDNALDAIMQYGILPNIGSPGMLDELARAGYKGNIAIRINPGFGHGHVNACDTGGPSSKHGIWFSQAEEIARQAALHAMKVVMLHAHIGSGPQMEELLANLRRLANEFARTAPIFPELEAFSFGGGIPHSYHEENPEKALNDEIAPLGPLFHEVVKRLRETTRREVRVEIEPGRYFVAPCAKLVARVTDIKKTEPRSASTPSGEKGGGQTFIMVDAGFVDLLRPAMYGSYHRISTYGPSKSGPPPGARPVVVAGPLCESGDVFTRDASDFIAPRDLPLPAKGDLLVIHDAGAYGYAMSSNYNSVGRAPQVWIGEDGAAALISRRETVDDILRLETETTL